MKPSEAAVLIDGAEYRNPISKEMHDKLKENNLVAVYTASDDLLEFRGAIYDETGIEARLNADGFWYSKCDNDSCPYAKEEEKQTVKITFNDESNPWRVDTLIPHHEFKLYEDGEVISIGIVFSMEALITCFRFHISVPQSHDRTN